MKGEKKQMKSLRSLFGPVLKNKYREGKINIDLFLKFIWMKKKVIGKNSQNIFKEKEQENNVFFPI